MADKTKENPDMKGIQIYDLIALISQLADDTNLFLKFEPVTLNGVIKMLSTIEQHVGLKVNYDKTKLYRIGSLANSDAKIYTIKEFTWTNNPVDVLGVQISNDIENIMEVNYQHVITKVDTVINL